jgi:hypothetical protein
VDERGEDCSLIFYSVLVCDFISVVLARAGGCLEPALRSIDQHLDHLSRSHQGGVQAHFRFAKKLNFTSTDQKIRRKFARTQYNFRENVCQPKQSKIARSTNLISCGKYKIVWLKVYLPYNFDAELACTVPHTSKKLSFANIFGKTAQIGNRMFEYYHKISFLRKPEKHFHPHQGVLRSRGCGTDEQSSSS